MVLLLRQPPRSLAPPFQTATTMLGCGLEPPLRGGFVFPWKISILTVPSKNRLKIDVLRRFLELF